jgi:hypothetical protein
VTALFSANKGEWFTPPEIIKRVHAVMGGIDLDPASCAKANTIVGAKQFFTAADDALNRPWHGRVFVNPPGTCPRGVVERYEDSYTGTIVVKEERFSVCGKTKVCTCDLPRKFWNKLMLEFSEGRVSCAIYLGFSLNQLATLQASSVPGLEGCTFKSPLDFPICVLRQRLKFLDSETLLPVPGPTQHNFVSYVNGSGMKFRAEFSSLGACK